MKTIRISKVEIMSVNFTETFYPYFQVYRDDYFNMEQGKEHYRLLSYLSTQFNNSSILDIGTANGHSALALSYNKKNVIHSFDIQDIKTSSMIKNIENVKYYFDDLFDMTKQQNWVEFIRMSPMIFLDVDPHNGTMEYSFYLFLKSINYKGIMICDDIHHFLEMRNNFWSKIPVNEKYDLTQYGHWSGTGLILFDTENVKIELI